jgi:hypothetical protein
MLFSRLFVCAQTETDTIQEPKVVYKTFAPYKSLFQVTVGAPLAVGSFGSRKNPFTDGYAYSFEAMNIDVAYSQPIFKNWNFIGELVYMRHKFASISFENSYQKLYGDKMACGTFYYENLILSGGIGYTYPVGRFLFTANAGVGGLYTFLPNGTEGVGLTVTKDSANYNNGNYKGGALYLGKTLSAMGFLGGGVKLLLNSDLYIACDVKYTWSYIKCRYTEQEFKNFTHTEHDYLTKNISIESIAFTIGLGVVFR